MRILIVSHPALRPEYGAAQMALNLGAALRDRGHDAVAWSPEPLPPQVRWWDRWLWQRRRLEEHLRRHRFDVVDTPAVSISRRVAASAPFVVARSVQPELLYQRAALRERRRILLPRSPHRLAAEAAAGWAASRAVVAGWRRAAAVLCLGSREAGWMRERFPWTAPKLAVYMNALSPADREALAAVRAGRRPRPDGATRFLWIGRWVPHKGTRRLVRFLAERGASHPGDTFTLAGSGEEALRECPPELVSEGRVRTVPAFGRGGLPELLAGHDAGLFTSEVEGWGLSLNEMLESGLPTYATEAGGVEDLRPCYPKSLRPFPPPDGPVPPAGDEPACDRFTWARIAERYEEDVLSRAD
jgi:glycosyltransferase involved in cell wall biosynthesis